MRMVSFREWLATRSKEAPAADRLALLVAQAGAAGISVSDLAKALGLPPETLGDLLRGLLTTGQVTVLKINGQMTYRATM
jgi:DNA-binding IclR family transcriptional regulator